MQSSFAKKVEQLFLNYKSISSAQINIKYTPPGTAEFIIWANGSDEDKTAFTNELNKLGPMVAKVMAKYQKDPIEWKWTTFEKPVG